MKMIRNEDAVSITLGFILIFFITILVFSAVIISFYTLSRQSQQIATTQSFDILGSGIALKISSTDGLINLTQYYGGTVNTLDYGFSIPASMASDDYSINITNGTNRVILLESDNGAKTWIPYNTSIMLEEKLFFSGIEDYKLTYNGTSNRIVIKEQ
ncbi:MAG: hypothetical protein WAW23_03250 [Candidatus Methanoperedens sp.]